MTDIFTTPDLYTGALLDDVWDEIRSKLTQPGKPIEGQTVGCRHWTGSHHGGHPVIRIRAKHYRVVPMILEATMDGPIDDDKNALHTCGDYQCLEPTHLYEGPERGIRPTPATRTYKHKGIMGTRQSIAARSVHNRAVKLTADAVRDIRSSSLSASDLAAKYGVDKMTVYYARTGKTHKHVE